MVSQAECKLPAGDVGSETTTSAYDSDAAYGSQLRPTRTPCVSSCVCVSRRGGVSLLQEDHGRAAQHDRMLLHQQYRSSRWQEGRARPWAGRCICSTTPAAPAAWSTAPRSRLRPTILVHDVSVWCVQSLLTRCQWQAHAPACTRTHYGHSQRWVTKFESTRLQLSSVRD